MNRTLERVVYLFALALLLCSGCSSSPQRSAPMQTDDKTGVSSYGKEWPPAYHKRLLEESRRAGR